MTKQELLEKLQAHKITNLRQATPGQLLSLVARNEKDLNVLYKASLALIAKRHGKEIMQYGGFNEFVEALDAIGAIRHNWTPLQVAKYMHKSYVNQSVNRRWKDTTLNGRHYWFVERVEQECAL